MTCTIVVVAVSRGRASANASTNTQYDGLAAAAAVRASPQTATRMSTARRPKRSARDARGSAKSDAPRRAARPSPRVVPESPTTPSNVSLATAWPKWCATSASDATAPNEPNPAAVAMRTRSKVTRSMRGRRSTELVESDRVVHHHERFATVATGEQKIECLGRTGEPVDHMFIVDQVTREHHGRERHLRFEES